MKMTKIKSCQSCPYATFLPSGKTCGYGEKAKSMFTELHLKPDYKTNVHPECELENAQGYIK